MSASRVQISSTPTGPTNPNGEPLPPPLAAPEAPAAPAVPPVTPPPVERAKWLPEKFKTPEDLAAAYAELEKKQSTPPPAEVVPPVTPEIDPATGKPKEVPAVVPPVVPPAANEQFKPFFEEFAKDGKLSDDSMAALEKQGFSRDVVEQFIAGGQAKQASHEAAVMESAGGADGYKAMTAWAASALTPTEIAAFNAVLESGDLGQTKLAVAGLAARQLAAEGSPAPRFRGAESPGVSTAAFKSSDEMVAAMNDPRYKTDEAFRQSVAQRLMASDAS